MTSNFFTFPGHNLATSALPNAPVVEGRAVARRGVRSAVAVALRSTAIGIAKLANRVEPVRYLHA